MLLLILVLILLFGFGGGVLGIFKLGAKGRNRYRGSGAAGPSTVVLVRISSVVREVLFWIAHRRARRL